MINNIDYIVKQICIDLHNERRDFDHKIEKGVAKKVRINLFNLIETDYETLNRMFGVKTKLQVIDEKLTSMMYYENLENSGIDSKIA